MAGPFVSRGGEKLDHALASFGLDVAGLVCADLGSSTGGFTDCLLRRGAARIYAVDTGYGILAWTLRNDPRVVVMERSNALHTDPPANVAAAGGVGLVVIDLGWTRQKHALPAARRWLKAGGRVVTLIKPHYEQEVTGGDEPTDAQVMGAAGPRGRGKGRRKTGILPDDAAEAVCARVMEEIAASGWLVEGLTESPIRGGKNASKGNREWLALLRPAP
jgi:23S rRNA (cytidine1920-2'-O)/16S rRNA (cytidine1409-2'-O)-methyltransferase